MGLVRLPFEASESRVSGFWFRVSGFGFRVTGFGFRVSGFGMRDAGSYLRLVVFVYHSTLGLTVIKKKGVGLGRREPRRERLLQGQPVLGFGLRVSGCGMSDAGLLLLYYSQALS